MGKLIDETDLMNLLYALDDARHDLCYAIKKISELPTVEAIPKDQYETRLKADMVATLKELQIDIQEVNTAPQFLTDDNVKDFREWVDTIIQQKINELKADQERKE